MRNMPMTQEDRTALGGGMQGYAKPSPNAGAEERVQCVRWMLGRRHAFTQIMRKTLELCSTRKSYGQVEEAMAGFPEFRYADQSQASIIEMLVFCEGLRKIELDRQGNKISPESKRSLSEDTYDDLLWSYALETTEAGAQAAAELDPETRLSNLFSRLPDRVGAYASVLKMCREPQTFESVEHMLRESGMLASMASLNTASSLLVYPSALVGELEEVGGLEWREAWVTTDAGVKALAEAGVA